MTSMKTLLSAGLVLAVASAALAQPTVKLLPAGTKGGALVVQGIANGGVITAIELHIKFDNAKLTVANSAGAFVANAAGGWATNAFNVLNSNEALWIGSNGNGQNTDGPIVSITFTGTATTKATMTTDTNWADDQFNVFSPPANQDAAVINGAVRSGLGAIAGAPSAGPGKVVAVAAGTSLKLLAADTLADVAGFAAPAVGPVSGRPSFGMVGTKAVIAVGDDAGKLTVADAATGVDAGSVTLSGKVSTPAIAADGIYAAVTPATGAATLVKVTGGAASPVATLAGSTVLGAPAVYSGVIAVGTEKGVESFRTDGTPQASVLDAAGATVAPIVGPGGLALSANSAKILGFNAVTGAATSSNAHTGGALSEAWLDGADTVVFGTPSGKILSVSLATGVPTLAGTALTTGAISAEPIIIGGVTYAIDASGNLASSAGLAAPLGSPAAKALAATGRTSGTDTIIAATADGTVASVAF